MTTATGDAQTVNLFVWCRRPAAVLRRLGSRQHSRASVQERGEGKVCDDVHSESSDLGTVPAGSSRSGGPRGAEVAGPEALRARGAASVDAANCAAHRPRELGCEHNGCAAAGSPCLPSAAKAGCGGRLSTSAARPGIEAEMLSFESRARVRRCCGIGGDSRNCAGNMSSTPGTTPEQPRCPLSCAADAWRVEDNQAERRPCVSRPVLGRRGRRGS